MRVSAWMVVVAAVAGCASAPPAPAAATPAGLEQIRLDAKVALALVHTPLARSFVETVPSLRAEPPRTLFRSADHHAFFTEADAAALPEAERSKLERYPVDEELFYNTKYGSPLAYARALDVLGDAGLVASPGEKLLDFGFGGIGHLRLLASLGFDTTGVDVDPFLRSLYSQPSDQGAYGSGSVRLLSGKYPTDPAIQSQVGGGYRVVVSKNVLKRGYIHPDRPADDRFLIHLGVDDATFLGAVHSALNEGGLLLIYNICPALTPTDKPFVPWSDGRSPFTEAQFREAGFEVLTFDRDDTAAVRTLGHALGWDRGEDAMDLEHDLSVIYTLVRKTPVAR